ncbi:MAG: polysaccharide deacetylase family protein [Candidatus Omnitrophota bacterium]
MVGSILKHVVPAFIIKQRLKIKGSILFTFDDGPHPEITPRVLDVLDRYGARGLFFISGNRIIKSPKVIQEIICRKHGIGNHGFTHTPCSKLSFRENMTEINKCKDELLTHSGILTNLYRPPKGIVTPSLIFAAWRCKYKIVRWSLDSGECSYMQNATSYALADNFLKKIHDRAIVLSHDTKDTVPGFLKLVLPRLLDEGFDLQKGLLSLRWSQNS